MIWLDDINQTKFTNSYTVERWKKLANAWCQPRLYHSWYCSNRSGFITCQICIFM